MTTPKQIIWCIDSPGYGGAEKTLMRVSGFLKHYPQRLVHGTDVAEQVKNWADTNNIPRQTIPSGAKISRLLPILWAGWKLSREHQDALFIIWCHHHDSSRWLQFAFILFNVRYVVAERGMSGSRKEFLNSKLTIPLKRWTTGFANAVILNASTQSIPFKHIFGVAGRNLFTIRNSRPVSSIAERVATLRLKRQELLDNNNIPKGSILIIYVGRLSEEKAQTIAIKAMVGLAENVKLVLVGDGPDHEQLKKLGSQLIPNRLILTGHVNDPIEWLAMADIFCLSSKMEGMPGSLIEAMAAGLPCVATDIPGCRELIQHGKTGLLFENLNSDSLHKQLNELINEPHYAQTLAEAGLEYVKSMFDETTEKHAWQNLIAKLNTLRKIGIKSPA